MFVEIGQLMPANQRSNATRYSRKLILQILQEVYDSGSQQEVKEKYGLTGSTLTYWLNKYGGEKYEQIKRSKVSPAKKLQVIRAIRENRMTREEAAIFCKVSKITIREWLKDAPKEETDVDSFDQKGMPFTSETKQDKELADAQLKIRALETLIDIAEEKFKISIRKKPGAKQ